MSQVNGTFVLTHLSLYTYSVKSGLSGFDFLSATLLQYLEDITRTWTAHYQLAQPSP